MAARNRLPVNPATLPKSHGYPNSARKTVVQSKFPESKKPTDTGGLST